MSNKDIEAIMAEARAQRAAILGTMIGNCIYFLASKLNNLTNKLIELLRTLKPSPDRERDMYFANSTSLSDLEYRMRTYGRNAY